MWLVLKRPLTILGIVFGIIGLLVLVIIPHNIRIRRVRKIFRSLPENVKEQVFWLIETAAADNPSVTYMLMDDTPCSEPETAASSHVGGVPYMESGETWPVSGKSDPALFLLQARPEDSSLGCQWHGRLITVFLMFRTDLIVRSHDAASPEKCVPIIPSVPSFRCIRLRSLPFPVASKDDPIPMSPSQLCDSIPEITELLSPFTDDSAGVLSQILHPNIYGYDLQEPDIAYQGGSPMLIQAEHDPHCDHCQQRMRFLFQFGEIIPGFRLADGGVGYVYGCDDHPEHCKGFLDSH